MKQPKHKFSTPVNRKDKGTAQKDLSDVVVLLTKCDTRDKDVLNTYTIRTEKCAQ